MGELTEITKKKRKNKPGGGRPTDFDPIFIAQVKKLAQTGATEMEIADFFGVTVRTVQRWKFDYPKFCRAAKIGRELPDERVKQSLFQRACGFEHNSVKVAFDKEGKPLYAPYREYIPPDTGAAIFWLKNRLPAEFRDKIEATVNDGKPLLSIQVVQAIKLALGFDQEMAAAQAPPALEASVKSEFLPE